MTEALTVHLRPHRSRPRKTSLCNCAKSLARHRPHSRILHNGRRMVMRCWLVASPLATSRNRRISEMSCGSASGGSVRHFGSCAAHWPKCRFAPFCPMAGGSRLSSSGRSATHRPTVGYTTCRSDDSVIIPPRSHSRRPLAEIYVFLLGLTP